MKPLALLLLLSSCCPSRTPEGKPRPVIDVIGRMFSRKDRNGLMAAGAAASALCYYLGASVFASGFVAGSAFMAAYCFILDAIEKTEDD